MNEMISGAVFYLLSAIIIIAALGVVTAHNLIHSALLLIVTFIGIGCLYFHAGADFVGASQLLVYAGAVGILIVLGIMLTHHADDAPQNPSRYGRLMPRILAGLFVLTMGLAYGGLDYGAAARPVTDTVGAIADLMLTRYILPFEIAAVLLLSALIGAIVLAKGADET